MAESKNQTNQSAPATMIHSIGELNRVLRALAVQSVGRAIQIQSQTITNASVSYISWLERSVGSFSSAPPLPSHENHMTEITTPREQPIELQPRPISRRRSDGQPPTP